MARTNSANTTVHQPTTVKSKRKRKAATNAIREIRAEQKQTNLIIPVAPMNRLVTEIAQNYKLDLRFKNDAYRALHVLLRNNTLLIPSKKQIDVLFMTVVKQYNHPMFNWQGIVFKFIIMCVQYLSITKLSK